MLDALRDGVGATAVGLFDDDRGGGNVATASARPRDPNFWEAFGGGLPCAQVDWSAWYGTLRAEQRVETTCSCGAAHRLHGYLLHQRWVLLLLSPHTLAAPSAAMVVSSALKVLLDMLPPARDRASDEAGAEDPLPDPFIDSVAAGKAEGDDAPVSVPLWWVRRARQ